jgi:hypothetical protein
VDNRSALSHLLLPHISGRTGCSDKGTVAALTLLAGTGIQLLILLTPYTGLSVFSYEQAPGTISEEVILVVELLVAFILAYGGYYGIGKAKERVSFVRTWLSAV